MKKIRLDLSELKVESFATSGGAAGAGGTVFGMDATNCDDTCDTIAGTCNGIGENCDSGACMWTFQGITCTIGPGPTDFCSVDPCSFTCNPPETCNPQCVTTEGPVGL